MSKLQDALQDALVAISNGETLESTLERTPELSEELRPLLRAAMIAGAVGNMEPGAEARRRSRAKILRRAAVLRGVQVRHSRRIIPALPRLAITLGLVSMLALTSTGLVSASNGALPGDQLYPVKRSWEGVQLLLMLRPQERQLLESHFEQERLDEIDELLTKGQPAEIMFSGLVMHQQDGSWIISGIPVSITRLTSLPAAAIAEGSPVSIAGYTRSDGAVEARRVDVLGPGVPLPPLEPSESEEERPTADAQGSGVIPTATPRPVDAGPEPATQAPQSFAFSGVVQSMGDTTWRINGQTVYVDQAAILGTVKVGSEVKLEGYYDPNGSFVVTMIQPDNSSAPNGSDKVPADKPGDSKPGDSKPGDSSPPDDGEGGG